MSQVSTITKSIKYPFIQRFVSAMSNIEAQDHVTNDLDLKTLLVFFQIYIVSCKKLKSQQIPLSDENVYQMMESQFELWRSDSQNYLENSVTLEFHENQETQQQMQIGP